MRDRVNNVPSSAPKVTVNRYLSGPFSCVHCRLRHVEIHRVGRQAMTSQNIRVILVEIIRNHPWYPSAVNSLSAPSSSSSTMGHGTGRYLVHYSASLSRQTPPSGPHRSATRRQGSRKDKDRALSSGSFRSTLDSLMLHIIPPICQKNFDSSDRCGLSSLHCLQQHRFCVTAFPPPQTVSFFCAIRAVFLVVQSQSFLEDTARDIWTGAGAVANIASKPGTGVH